MSVILPHILQVGRINEMGQTQSKHLYLGTKCTKVEYMYISGERIFMKLFVLTPVED